MRRPSLLLLPLAFACGRKLDPTIASAPGDAVIYLRVRSWEELLSAAPILRMMVARSGERGPLPRDLGLDREVFDVRRPFGVGVRPEGVVLVLPRSEVSSPVPVPGGEWSVEPLAGGALGLWEGPKPSYGNLAGGDLMEGLVSLRLFPPRLAAAPDDAFARSAAALAAGGAFLGVAPEGTPGERVRSWKATLLSLETLDLAVEFAGGRFDVRARLRPSPESGVGRFASEARGAAHTLAGFLSKEGTILYAESSLDAATHAAFFPKGFLAAGPVPFALPGTLGPLGGELAGLLDGREVFQVGHVGGALFVEQLGGLRDGGAYADLLASDRFADAIEDAVMALPFLREVVCERNAFRHGEVAVHRLRFALGERGTVRLLRIPDEFREALDRFGSCCFAVVGDLLVAADGADAEARIRALLDRVRSGRLDRPPLAATLGSSRGRLAGIAADLGEGRRAFLGDRVPAAFGGRISATLEARGGALELAGIVEVRTPIPEGIPGLPR